MPMITEMWMDGPNGYGKLKFPTPTGQLVNNARKQSNWE